MLLVQNLGDVSPVREIEAHPGFAVNRRTGAGSVVGGSHSGVPVRSCGGAESSDRSLDREARSMTLIFWQSSRTGVRGPPETSIARVEHEALVAGFGRCSKGRLRTLAPLEIEGVGTDFRIYCSTGGIFGVRWDRVESQSGRQDWTATRSTAPSTWVRFQRRESYPALVKPA